MRPKTLQGILGHANIGITMNLYVHNTEEEKEKEIKKFEEAFQLCLVQKIGVKLVQSQKRETPQTPINKAFFEGECRI